MPPARLSYTVVSCDSDDDGYSAATELIKPGPACKGWRSQEYCLYPQELVLQLEKRSVVERIQFLVHNTMIPSSTIIHLGDVGDPNDDAPDFRKALYMEVGRVDWNNNKENRFRGRQLQTVELAGAAMKARFIRLTVKKNHINRYNEYNQVSFIGINVLGTPPEGTEHVTAPAQEDLAFLMYTDPDICEVMRKLECRRIAAQDAGRSEYLHKLRHALAGLEIAGKELGAAESAKKKAVEKGKYEEAGEKKKEIEKDREDIYKEYRVHELLEKDGHLAVNDEKTPLPPLSGRRRKSTMSLREVPHEEEERARSRSKSRSRSRSRSSKRPASLPERVRTPTPPREPSPPPPPTPPPFLPPPSPRKSKPPRKPLPLKRGSTEPNLKPSAREGSRTPDPGAAATLTQQEKREYELPIEVFGKRLVAGALSKNAQVKEDAVKKIKCRVHSAEVEDYSPDDGHKPGKFLRATTILLKKLLKEKLWSIFSLGIEIHQTLFTSFADTHNPPDAELKKTSNLSYAELLIRAGDSADRIGDKAQDSIKTMLKNERVRHMDNLQFKLTEPLKGQGKDVPKQAVARTELVHFLVKELNDFYSMKDLTHFALSAVKHTSPAVRTIGIKLLLRLYDKDPKTVMRIVPEETPAVRKEFVGLKNFYDELDNLERRRKEERKAARKKKPMPGFAVDAPDDEKSDRDPDN